MPLPCVATHSSGDVKHIHPGIGQCLAGIYTVFNRVAAFSVVTAT